MEAYQLVGRADIVANLCSPKADLEAKGGEAAAGGGAGSSSNRPVLHGRTPLAKPQLRTPLPGTCRKDWSLLNNILTNRLTNHINSPWSLNQDVTPPNKRLECSKPQFLTPSHHLSITERQTNTKLLVIFTSTGSSSMLV